MIVVITGASSGLGAAIARRCARDPSTRLLIVARRADRLQALVEETGATALAADLTAPDTPDRIVKQVEHDFGRLDVLINNAGAHRPGTFRETGWDNVREAMALNFDAHVRVTEALLPLLRASAPSSIVNIGSVAGRVGLAGSGAYSAAKFGSELRRPCPRDRGAAAAPTCVRTQLDRQYRQRRREGWARRLRRLLGGKVRIGTSTPMSA